jgi:peptidoglycan/LPS O-acetylase OafA/YrhL
MGSAVTMVLGAGVMGLVCFVMANLARRSGSERPCVRAPELPKLPRIDVIDGFRVLGISLIILSHQTYNLPACLALVVKRSNNAMHSSEPLLFIVSGFVLMHVMAQKVEHFVLGTGTALIARRLARLLPAYYLALVGCMAFSAGQSKISEPNTWASAATLSQSLIPLSYCDTPNHDTAYFPFGYAGNGPAWFTSAMVILSFCFPPIFNVVRDFDFATSVAWLILVALLRCACIQTMYTAGVEELASGVPVLPVHTYAPWHLSAFVMGMLCSQICRKTHSIMGWSGWGLVLDGVCALWAFGSFRGVAHGPKFVRFEIVWLCAHCLFCVAGYGISVSSEALKEDSSWTRIRCRGIMGTVLSNSVLVSLADYSFSAYILQGVAFQGVYIVCEYLGLASSRSLWCLPFVVTWALSLVVVPHLEKPAQKTVAKWISG